MGSTHARLLPALLVVLDVWGRVAAVDCWARTEEVCLGLAGCRWFSYEPKGQCELCRSWFGDQKQITGCHDWETTDYCSRLVFLQALKLWGHDPSESTFREAVEHYHVTQGNGETGNPHHKRWQCRVWCDTSDPYVCMGQPKAQNEFRGVNYGGRFVPERYLGLPGTSDLFKGVHYPREVMGKRVGGPSLCDVGQAPDAGDRMRKFLDLNVRLEHFERMGSSGFNVVRLPLGYWNLIDLPGASTPNGINGSRWRDLQRIMPAVAYFGWINRIFAYAERNGLKVLLDLHGAPGAQAGNAFTGCDEGNGNHHFDTQWNKMLAIRAVKKMAKLCARHGATCYGIELLNEPAVDSAAMRVFLRGYYNIAIKAARRYLDRDTPLIIMDWPRWLGWWNAQQAFSYAEHGRVMFSTHMYDASGVTDQDAVRRYFSGDMATISHFQSVSKYDVFVSEYALSGHGSGEPNVDAFDYHSLANWLVHQFNRHSLGSAVWNYDAGFYVRTWGPVASTNLGARPVEWSRIFGLRPPRVSPGASLGPPIPLQQIAGPNRNRSKHSSNGSSSSSSSSAERSRGGRALGFIAATVSVAATVAIAFLAVPLYFGLARLRVLLAEAGSAAQGSQDKMMGGKGICKDAVSKDMHLYAFLQC
mmetsp:Transcript_110353/g.312041  ORF Transcript_110353/g.312041 Transcript_110353/m.312041 type:complete len:642 (-) Transcript_110353:309-2234(-)